MVPVPEKRVQAKAALGHDMATQIEKPNTPIVAQGKK
jgi:hypothetical protein